MQESIKMYDIIVIGCGVAGMTAALYARRNGMTVLVIEADTIGGQISKSPKVENFPTIPSIEGMELAEKLFEQITEKGAEFELDTVKEIVKDGKEFTVKTEYSEFKSKAVIIASGVKHRELGLENEEKFIGNGISYCALCDGAFYEGQEVCLIGDANTALQYALLLSNTSSKVRIFTLFDKFFADKALVDAIKSRDNISYVHNHKLIELKGGDELEAIVFEKEDGSKEEVACKGLFVAIGQVPDNQKFANLVELDKVGYIVADESCTTKTEGLFVAGDCRTKSVRQLSTAVGDGAVASTAACNYINKNF
jgi:thioredoxin reductase (NADPH)